MVTANDAAAIAIQLFRLDARLCDQNPLKVARTTNNPSVSGNTLHESTSSIACCSNTLDIQCLSHDASVQTNTCTVFQVNPVHTTDLTRSLSDTQITQTTSTCSQTDSERSSSSIKIVNTQPLTKEYVDQPIASLEFMAQKQEDTSAQVSKEVNENSLKTTDDNVDSSEQNGTSDKMKAILNHLDVASLSIPDSILNKLPDMSVMEIMPLKHIASFQTGNYVVFC